MRSPLSQKAVSTESAPTPISAWRSSVTPEIGERERPFEAVLERLDTIPDVGRRIAEIIVAEVGPDVRRFPSAGHLASWAGLCPGQDESAGKRRSGKTRKGNPLAPHRAGRGRAIGEAD